MNSSVRVCFTLVQQLHAVEGGQGGEQTGVETHGQQVPEPTLIQSFSTWNNNNNTQLSLLLHSSSITRVQ